MTSTIIKTVDPSQYPIAMAGHPSLHRNLEWFATANDAVLGVVVEDLVDHDFTWVVLTQNDQGPGYTAIDLAINMPTQQAATESLHTAMGRQP